MLMVLYLYYAFMSNALMIMTLKRAIKAI